MLPFCLFNGNNIVLFYPVWKIGTSNFCYENFTSLLENFGVQLNEEKYDDLFGGYSLMLLSQEVLCDASYWSIRGTIIFYCMYDITWLMRRRTEATKMNACNTFDCRWVQVHIKSVNAKDKKWSKSQPCMKCRTLITSGSVIWEGFVVSVKNSNVSRYFYFWETQLTPMHVKMRWGKFPLCLESN